MALEKCRDCGGAVSAQATACIHCGCPTSQPEDTATISCGASSTSYFIGEVQVQMSVLSPITEPAPYVVSSLSLRLDGTTTLVTMQDGALEELIDVLIEVKKHISLLEGAERSFFQDEAAILFCSFSAAVIRVTRAKKLFGGFKDELHLKLGELEIRRELNDDFFRHLSKLQSDISAAKEAVAERVRAYIARSA